MQADAHRLLSHRYLSIRNVRANNAQARLLLPLDFTRVALKFDGLVALQELALEIRHQLHGVMSGLRHRRRGRTSAKNAEQRNSGGSIAERHAQKYIAERTCGTG